MTRTKMMIRCVTIIVFAEHLNFLPIDAIMKRHSITKIVHKGIIHRSICLLLTRSDKGTRAAKNNEITNNQDGTEYVQRPLRIRCQDS